MSLANGVDFLAIRIFFWHRCDSGIPGYYLFHRIVFNLLHLEVSVGRVAGDRQKNRSSQRGADCNWRSLVSVGPRTQRGARKLGSKLVVLELEWLQLHVSEMFHFYNNIDGNIFLQVLTIDQIKKRLIADKNLRRTRPRKSFNSVDAS